MVIGMGLADMKRLMKSKESEISWTWAIGCLKKLEMNYLVGAFDPTLGYAPLGRVVASIPKIVTTTTSSGYTQLTISQNVTVIVYIGTGSFILTTTHTYTLTKDALGDVVEGGRQLTENGASLSIGLSFLTGGNLNSAYQNNSQVQAFQSLVR